MAADRAASPVPAGAVNALIGRAGLALDDEDFQAFLDLCTTDFRYRIRVESPELDQEMTWLEQTRTELKTMFASLPEHLTRPGRLTRQVCVASTHERRGRIQVTSVFSIFHTDLAGRTRILAVGRYLDEIVADQGSLRLRARDVQLHTRDLGIGSHVPL